MTIVSSSYLLRWIVAFAPLLVLLVSLTLFRCSVARAALFALGATLLSSALIGTLHSSLLSSALLEGLQNSSNILYAIWPALFLYELLKASGVFERIQVLADKLCPNDLICALFISWLFASFLQSISGFGVPLAVCAPILLARGIPAQRAIPMILLGHSWGNTYGTLGMAWGALDSFGPVRDHLSTAHMSALLLYMVMLSGVLISCVIYKGFKGLREGLPFVLPLSLIMGISQYYYAKTAPELAAFIPALAGLIAMVLIYGKKSSLGSAAFIADTIVPFAILALLSVLVFALPFSKNALESLKPFGVPVFSHAGFVLSLSTLLSYLFYRKRALFHRFQLKRAISQALRKLIPVSIGIIGLIIIARLLDRGGQVAILAQGFADLSGPLYPLFSPLLAMMGAFMTSSNVSSNILLAGFQAQIAHIGGIPSALYLAGQTAGGAIGIIVSPSTLLLGCATTESVGREGELLRRLFPIAIAQALLLGLVLFTLVRLAF